MKLCALYCAVRCRGAQSETRYHPTVCPILHPGMARGPGNTQNHGLPDDTYTSSEYSTDSEDSLSLTKLSSDEEEIKDQGSKVSNTRPFIRMQSLVTTHQDVSCTSFPQPCRSPLSLPKVSQILMKNQSQSQ